jgi:hypothetical protein
MFAWLPPPESVIDGAFLGDLRPRHVLLEYDGPIMFVADDAAEQPILCYQCDQNEDAEWRYVVSAVTNELASDLENGRVTILDAIRQTRSWLADVDTRNWTVHNVYRVKFSDLPDDYRPNKSAYLNMREDAAVRMRFVAESAEGSDSLLSMMKFASERISSAIGIIVNQIKKSGKAGSIPDALAKKYSDLPVLQLGLGSLDVFLGFPNKPIGESASENEQHKLIVNEMTAMWRSGTKYLTNGSEDSLPSDPEEALAILKAMQQITPSYKSGVTAVELSGSLSSTRKLRLTKDYRTRINNGINQRRGKLQPSQMEEYYPKAIYVTGKIEGIDNGADKKIFTMRHLVVTAAWSVLDAPEPEVWPYGDEVCFKYYGNHEDMLHKQVKQNGTLRVTGLLFEPVAFNEGTEYPLYRSVDIVVIEPSSATEIPSEFPPQGQ